MSRKLEIEKYEGSEKQPVPITKKPGFWASLAALLLCLVCLVPIFGGVLVAGGAATQFLQGETLMIAGVVIIIGGVFASVLVYKRHKKKASCDSDSENPSCKV